MSDNLLTSLCFASTAVVVCAGNAKNKTVESSRPRRRRAMAPEGSRPIAELSVGEDFLGIVREVGGANSAWLDINCATLTGKSIRARLRLPRNPSRSNISMPVKGAVVPVRVSKLDVDAARVEVSVRRPSHERKELTCISGPTKSLEELEAGQQLDAIVLAVTQKGAVVDAGVTRKGPKDSIVKCTGLLLRKHFLEDWASDADLVIPDSAKRIVSAGDKLTLFVRQAHPQNGRLFLDAHMVTKEQMDEEREAWFAKMRNRQKRKGVEVLKVGDLRKGVVCDVKKYGCFVDLGLKKDGLIHYSAMGETHRATWKTSISLGAEVVVSVVSVAPKRIDLELIGLVDEVDENVSSPLNLATARSKGDSSALQSKLQGRNTPDKGPVKQSELPVHTHLKSSYSNTSSEGSADSFDEKFTDEYFEDKYYF